MTTRRQLYRAMVVHDPAAVAVSWRVRALAERLGTRVTAVEFRVGERVWRWRWGVDTRSQS